MNKLVKTAIAAATLTITPAAFACDYPSNAEYPPGATASKDEMLAGQRSVKTYMAAMEAYLACLEQEEQEAVAAMGDISDEEKASREAAMTKKYNAAVEQMELVAARFNEEVRAYKAAQDAQ